MLKHCMLIILASSLLVGCASDHSPNKIVDKTESATEQKSDVTECQEPRPQMCTREYNPVCATRDTGVRCVTEPCPASERLTYPTGCTACADPKVVSHVPGACPDTVE